MPTVLALMAHPDDVEFTCAGLLTLLRQAGWDVHIATMTPGDLGSATLSSEEIARVRRGEAAASAALLEATYTCLEYRDLTVVYGEETKRTASAILRMVRPDLLVTLHPSDYMEDHTETARIAREAAFVSTIAQLDGAAPRWPGAPSLRASPRGALRRSGGQRRPFRRASRRRATSSTSPT